MSDSTKHKIFSSGNCITEQAMFDYIDNKLSPKECHIVEKHLLDCELCSDALQGFEMLKNRKHTDIINNRVNEFIATKQKKIIPINYRTIIAIAAGLALLIGGVFLFNHFTSIEMKEKTVTDLKETPTVTLPVITEEIISTEEKSERNISEGENKPQELTQERIREPKKPEIIISNEAAPVIPSAGSGTSVSEQAIDKDLEKSEDDINGLLKETKKNKAANEPAEGYSMPAAVAPKFEQREGKENSPKTDSDKKAFSKSNKKMRSKVAAYESNSPQSVSGNEGYNMDMVSLSNTTDSVYTIVDEMPEFPGGETALFKYVRESIQFAAVDDKGNAYETLQIQFIIDPVGKAIDPKLLKPQSIIMEKQVIEMVNKMPIWEPGKLNGKIVPVKFNLPVKIAIK